MRGRGALAGVVLMTSAAHADPAKDPCACSPNKPGFFRRDALSGRWGGLRDDLRDGGVNVQATYASEVFASPGLDDRVVVAGLAMLAVDVDLGEGTHDTLGWLRVSGLAIHGDGISSELMDVYGVSNNVAENDVRLFEAWYEQPFGDAAVRAGLLAADQEFILARHGTALLNATFGIISQVPVNAGPPVYPIAAPGVSARYERAQLTLRAAVFDADPASDHGLPEEFDDDALVMSEIELWGTLKLGAWDHSERGAGTYAIADRRIAPRTGAFTRVGLAPDAPVSLYIDSGIRLGPHRGMDFASVGLAFARTQMGAQTAVELTYQLQLLGWLSIQPDLQLLLLPDRTAGIVATRVIVAL